MKVDPGGEYSAHAAGKNGADVGGEGGDAASEGGKGGRHFS